MIDVDFWILIYNFFVNNESDVLELEGRGGVFWFIIVVVWLVVVVF